MSIPKQVIRLCVLLTLAAAARAGASGTDRLVYDASISFLQAGQIELERNYLDDHYELGGSIETSAMLKPFFSWSGQVAAVGSWSATEPITRGYLLDSIGRKGRRELTLVAHERFTQYRSTRGWKESEAPPGTDIMSVLFMSPGCFGGNHIHDGEDSYPIELRREESERVDFGSKRYTGMTRRCDYYGEDLRGRKRDVTVWLAKPPGLAQPAPVKIKVSVPRAPAGILLLKVEAP